MRNIVAIVATVAVVAAGASAAYYVDERFNGPVPPTGWSMHNENGGYWTRYATGGVPSGPCAVGDASGNQVTAVACMETFSMDVPQGKTLYYRFYYQFHVGVYGYNITNAFYIYYTDNDQRIVDLANMPNYSNWTLVAGSAAVSRAAPLRASWKITGAHPENHVGGCSMFLDVVQLSDESFIPVAPASFGRVKALFR